MNGVDKAESIRFDWETIRDHADFRDLDALVKAAEGNGYKAENYTASSFSAYIDAYNAAKQVLGNIESSQETINAAYSRLKQAIKGLAPIQNLGKANTANLGISAFNAPFFPTEG